MCRSSGAEIYDLAWSPDGSHFIIGSMDNIARIYNATSGTTSCLLAPIFVVLLYHSPTPYDVLTWLKDTLSVRSRSIVTTFKACHGIPWTNTSPPNRPTALSTSTL